MQSYLGPHVMLLSSLIEDMMTTTFGQMGDIFCRSVFRQSRQGGALDERPWDQIPIRRSHI